MREVALAGYPEVKTKVPQDDVACCSGGTAGWYCTDTTTEYCTGYSYATCMAKASISMTGSTRYCGGYTVAGPDVGVDQWGDPYPGTQILCANNCHWACNCIYGACSGQTGPIENDGLGCNGGNVSGCCGSGGGTPGTPAPSCSGGGVCRVPSCLETESGTGQECSGGTGDCCVPNTCTPSAGHNELPVDCPNNPYGFYGRTFATLGSGGTTKPIAETYSCAPYSRVIGGTVCNNGYWSNRWTGYLNITDPGDYEFWIPYNPMLVMKMDVNQSGTFA
jgi:hypothetical protein